MAEFGVPLCDVEEDLEAVEKRTHAISVQSSRRHHLWSTARCSARPCSVILRGKSEYVG
jgi:hypothetical protein